MTLLQLICLLLAVAGAALIVAAAWLLWCLAGGLLVCGVASIVAAVVLYDPEDAS